MLRPNNPTAELDFKNLASMGTKAAIYLSQSLEQAVRSETLPDNFSFEKIPPLPDQACFVKPNDIYDDKAKQFLAIRKVLYLPKKIKTRKGKEKIIPRYFVIGKTLGEGASGQVSEIEGILIPKRGKGVVYKEKKYALKSSKDPLTKEFQLIHDYADYLQIKPLISAKLISANFYSSNSHLVEKFFPTSLANFLKENENLAMDTRLVIASKLLLALKEQIHDKGLLHRDIKPANIVIDYRKNLNGEIIILDVYFIDFGLSREAIKDDQRYPGSTQFTSTENIIFILQKSNSLSGLPYDLVKNAKIDELSDVYCLALTLERIFKGTGRRGATQQIIFQNIYDSLKNNLLPDSFDDLFAGINDTSSAFTDLKNDITQLLLRMSDPNRSSRFTLDKAIEAFETLRLIYKLEQVDKKNHKAICTANRLGVKIREGLKCTPVNSIKICELVRQGLNELRSLPEETQSLALKEFLEALDIKILSFDQLNTIEEVESKIQQITSEFTQQVNVLKKLLEEVTKDIQLLENNKNKTQVDIDKIEELEEDWEEINYQLEKTKDTKMKDNHKTKTRIMSLDRMAYLCSRFKDFNKEMTDKRTLDQIKTKLEFDIAIKIAKLKKPSLKKTANAEKISILDELKKSVSSAEDLSTLNQIIYTWLQKSSKGKTYTQIIDDKENRETSIRKSITTAQKQMVSACNDLKYKPIQIIEEKIQSIENASTLFKSNNKQILALKRLRFQFFDINNNKPANTIIEDWLKNESNGPMTNDPILQDTISLIKNS